MSLFSLDPHCTPDPAEDPAASLLASQVPADAADHLQDLAFSTGCCVSSPAGKQGILPDPFEELEDLCFGSTDPDEAQDARAFSGHDRHGSMDDGHA